MDFKVSNAQNPAQKKKVEATATSWLAGAITSLLPKSAPSSQAQPPLVKQQIPKCAKTRHFGKREAATEITDVLVTHPASV